MGSMRVAFLLLFFAVSIIGCTPATKNATGEAAPAHDPGLESTSWKWVSFSSAQEQFEVAEPGNYTVSFNNDGTVSLKADCNHAAGKYEITGTALSLEIGPSTLAFCPPDSRGEEFLRLLSRAFGYSIEQGNLKITLPEGEHLSFAPANAQLSEPGEQSPPDGSSDAVLSSGLLGKWEWVSFQGMDDTTLETPDPSRYTLEFRVDGISVLADCNRGRGGFNLAGSSLSFTEIATTRMACPPDSLSERYLGYLSYVRGYVMKDGSLYLSLFADGGIMEFRPTGGPS